jgi:mono/diheme cytochrome c family protein
VLALEAERGADLFASRGCAACHSIGAGLRVGPDLAGILERREPEWVVGMITRPDSMLLHDPIARDLATEYRANMPRLGIEPEDARALVAFVGTREEVRPEGAVPHSCPCPGYGHRRHAGRNMRSGG